MAGVGRNAGAGRRDSIIIQINGKTRDKVTVPASITEEEAREIILAKPKVKTYIEGKEIIKIIYVPRSC
jgi:leucyl-tRNA synthetase